MPDSAAVSVPKTRPVQDIDYGNYARLLRIYADPDGRINYPALERDKEILRDAVADIGSVSQRRFAGLTRQGQMALLINAYNLYAIDLVVSNWPIRRNWLTGWLYPGNSIRQIAGALDGTVHQLLDTGYTLDEIEHNMLGEQYSDVRVHLALACASLGGPPLRHSAYTADSLEAQLESQVRAFLAKPENFLIDRDVMVVTMSEFFDWRAPDFLASGYTHLDSLAPAHRGDDGPSDEERAVIEFIMGYQSRPDREFLEAGGYLIEYSGFDWSLNLQPDAR